MNTFLYETTLDIYNRHIQNMDEVEIVVPGKRAAIYIRKYLGQIAGKVNWSPSIVSISEWLSRYTQYTVADRLVLLNELYLSYNELFDDEPMPMDRFWPLGEIILHDFNEIDNYSEQPLQILKLLAGMQNDAEDALNEEQNKAIADFLSYFKQEHLSEEKSQYFGVLKKLPLLYESFGRKLLRQKIAYEGLQGQDILRKIAKGQLDASSRKWTYAVGFNALNIVQIRLFEHLMHLGQLHFYWDADDYYIQDTRQEAGLFLRESLERFATATLNSPAKSLVTRTSPIKLISATGVMAQAEAMATSLSALDKNKRVAVILADEAILLPVLQRIPVGFDKVNITLGYSIKNSYLYNLVQILLGIYDQLSSENGVYIPDVITFLRNPVVKNGFEKETTEFENFLIAQYEPYVGADILKLCRIPIFSGIEKKTETATELSEKLLKLIFEMYSQGKNIEEVVNHSLIDEFYFMLFERIQQISNVLTNNNLQISVTLFIKILKAELEKIEIALQGSTDDGLQIMGVLESRNLDFDHVIFVGANDDVFPKSGASQSFIPESVRHYFKLPVMKQKNAIFAYYFYRAMQRAENIEVIFSGISESGPREVTRYVKQLQMESPFGTEEYMFYQKLELAGKSSVIEIEKTPAMMAHLHKYLDPAEPNAFSASLLSKYMQCSLQFYFADVAHLSEPQEFVEELEANTYGILLHTVLQLLYKPYLGKKIQKSDFDDLNKRVSDTISSVYKEKFSMQEPGGMYIIAKKALEQHVHNVLKFDKNRAPFTILGLEKWVRGVYPVSQNRQAKIRGVLDRIQERNDVYEIIDYKTGTSKVSVKDIQKIFSREGSFPKDVFQQLLYTYITEKNPAQPVLAVPNLYLMNEMTDLETQTEITIGERNLVNHRVELMSEFREGLNGVFEEIFSPHVSFEQTQEEQNCEYCAYKNICRR